MVRVFFLALDCTGDKEQVKEAVEAKKAGSRDVPVKPAAQSGVTGHKLTMSEGCIGTQWSRTAPIKDFTTFRC